MIGCVTPQKRPAATVVAPSPVATQGVSNAASPEQTAQAPVAKLMRASDEYRKLLEEQLLCPAKTGLAIAATLKKSVDAGVIPRQYKASNESHHEGKRFPVIADLTVFGYKVVALEFVGSDNEEGAGINAYVVGSYEGLQKVFKNRSIKLRKIKGIDGYTGTRPYGHATGYMKKDGEISIGCFIPVD